MRGLEGTGILISYRVLYRCCICRCYRLFRCFRIFRRFSFIISFLGVGPGFLATRTPLEERLTRNTSLGMVSDYIEILVCENLGEGLD